MIQNKKIYPLHHITLHYTLHHIHYYLYKIRLSEQFKRKTSATTIRKKLNIYWTLFYIYKNM